ncbi:MAG: hypothetical protein HFI81_04435 [Eubacterium sp.]|nr:hypothetical protein [Eubacterium sp.]
MQDNKKTLGRNAEGYADHTAGRACVNAHREQIIRERERAALHKEIMKNLVSYVRKFMGLFGYELVWITYRDPETGQEWKKK